MHSSAPLFLPRCLSSSDHHFGDWVRVIPRAGGWARHRSEGLGGGAGMAPSFILLIVFLIPLLTASTHNTTAGGCAIIRPPRDGGIRYRGLTQEQIRSVQVLPVDYEIEYICRGNREIVGPKVRKCLPNGTWTDLSQRSRCLLQCPRVWTSLENGRVSEWPPGVPVEGTELQYRCLPGFILVGRNSTHCNSVGKWNSPKPVCHYDRHYTGAHSPNDHIMEAQLLPAHISTPSQSAPQSTPPGGTDTHRIVFRSRIEGEQM
ncbi:hypothetical protein DPEC_G00287780 [Dallia pectoralis]|uniref:Uncharacterized protein n=1 Tax=Dallia pectoralis TaxID=75939 RepID=A0ACC2FKM3_DALPE|nr:hypothetical protein DPEC_G00287780 [Dallia pectoralis]